MTTATVAELLRKLSTRHALEAFVETMVEEHLPDLYKRVAALEKKQKEWRFRGVFSTSEKYYEGNFVVHNGSTWTSLRDEPGYPGAEGTGWQLCAKHGRDARDR